MKRKTKSIIANTLIIASFAGLVVLFIIPDISANVTSSVIIDIMIMSSGILLKIGAKNAKS